MKTRKYWISVLVLVSCMALLSVAVYAISSWEKIQIKMYGISTLNGLKGVYPLVTLITDEETKLGIMKDALQTEVELELRKGGIKVFEDANDREVGMFCVYFNVAKVETIPFYVFHFSAYLRQEVRLTRNPRLLSYATTWPAYPESRAGSVGELYLEESIRQVIADLTKEFINDYLAANPKEPAKKLGLRLSDLPEPNKRKDKQTEK